MVGCFVPKCTTGYPSQRAKGLPQPSMFSIPKDPAMLKRWRRCIPRSDRVLQGKDKVCALHFPEHMIRRCYIHVIEGKTITIPRGAPILEDGAYPCIFPNFPSHYTKIPAKRKNPPKRHAATAPKKRNNMSSSSVLQSDDLCQFFSQNHPGIISCGEPVVVLEPLTFRAIRELSMDISLPSPLWARHHDAAETFLSFCHVAESSTEEHVQMDKAVVFGCKNPTVGKATVLICGVTIEVVEKHVRSAGDLEELLRNVDKMKACTGPRIPQTQFSPGCKGLADTNKPDGICSECLKARKAAQMREYRQRNKRVVPANEPKMDRRTLLQKIRRMTLKMEMLKNNNTRVQRKAGAGKEQRCSGQCNSQEPSRDVSECSADMTDFRYVDKH